MKEHINRKSLVDFKHYLIENDVSLNRCKINSEYNVLDECYNRYGVINEGKLWDTIKKAIGLGDKVQPRNKEELVQIINTTIKTYGNDCDLTFIDTSKITDMSHLFSHSKFNGDISKWDTSKVTTMKSMFERSLFTGVNGDIGNWDTSKVTNMSKMFYEGKGYTGNLSNWNFKNVKDMSMMFGSMNNKIKPSTPSSTDLAKWKVYGVKNMFGMFMNSKIKKTTDLSKWDVSVCLNLSSMFDGTPLKGKESKFFEERWKQLLAKNVRKDAERTERMNKKDGFIKKGVRKLSKAFGF